MTGENCRSGCRTRDHETYGECCRAAAPNSRNSTQSVDRLFGLEAKRDIESREYRAARAQGIQPATTRLPDIRAAVAASQKADTALTIRS
jgi:hypothetical protein